MNGLRLWRKCRRKEPSHVICNIIVEGVPKCDVTKKLGPSPVFSPGVVVALCYRPIVVCPFCFARRCFARFCFSNVVVSPGRCSSVLFRLVC